MARSRARISIAVAVIAHGALTAAVALRPLPSRGPPGVETNDAPQEIDLSEATPEAPAPTSRATPDEAAALARSRTSPALATAHLTPPEPQGDGTPAVEPSAPGPAASTGSAGAPWTFDPTGASTLVSPAALARAGRAVGSETAPTGPGPFAAALGNAIDAQDRDKGTSRGGPVIAALERATVDAGSDLVGVATFNVGVDATGRVSVAVVKGSPSPGAWSAVAEAVRRGLVGSAVHVPPGARGWEVIAQVEAKLAYPNGVDPKTLGNSAEAHTFHATETKDRIVIDDLPALKLRHAGKVCSVGLTLGLPPGIEGGCDPSNVGAQALRQVHARVVSEGRF